MKQIQQFDISDKEDSTKYDWKKLDLDKTNKGWLNFVQEKVKKAERIR